jgi:hypothetical protein
MSLDVWLTHSLLFSGASQNCCWRALFPYILGSDGTCQTGAPQPLLDAPAAGFHQGETLIYQAGLSANAIREQV